LFDCPGFEFLAAMLVEDSLKLTTSAQQVVWSFTQIYIYVYIIYIYIIEGSLEVKLPTKWTVEKQR